MVNEVLKQKTRIQNDYKVFNKNYIPINDCLKGKDDQLFILGILGKFLEKIGISVNIENKSNLQNDCDVEYDKNLLQLICNNYILKYKYILDFALKKDRKKELLKDDVELLNFHEKIKNTFMQIYNLKEEEFVIDNYKKSETEFTVIIIFKSDFNKDIKKEELLNIFKNDKDLKTFININKELIIPSIKLKRCILEPKANNKDDSFWTINEKRGNEDYFPPIGWIKYGLRVFNCYDNKNNIWLGSKNMDGEWCIGYCGFTGINIKMKQKYENDNDIKHPGKKVGLGVYCSQKPEIMEKNTEIIDINGINYKVGFMVRLKPDIIRCPETNKDIWVVNGNENEIRPYGIIIKKNMIKIK